MKPPDLRADQRAGVMFAKKDFDGVAVWQRVGRAIEELERQKPREGEVLN